MFTLVVSSPNWERFIVAQEWYSLVHFLEVILVHVVNALLSDIDQIVVSLLLANMPDCSIYQQGLRSVVVDDCFIIDDSVHRP